MQIRGTCYVGKCDLFMRHLFGMEESNYSVHARYFDVGKAFIGVPVLALLFALALCWVADGFRRTTRTEVGPD